MKLALTLLCLITLNAFAAKKVPMVSGKLFIPQGYDSNDLTEVVVMGKLPDLCHRNPTYEVIRRGNTFSIYLYAYYVPETRCQKRVIPYMEQISLGVLPPGNYKVELKAIDAMIDHAPIKIKPASSGFQDDFQYGNVMGIMEHEAGRVIEIVGTNHVNCLKFDKLQATIQKEVIVLQPLFKEVGRCRKIPTPFRIKYEVPYLSNHPKGILLHVRVMDGRSYNYFYQNKL